MVVISDQIPHSKRKQKRGSDQQQLLEEKMVLISAQALLYKNDIVISFVKLGKIKKLYFTNIIFEKIKYKSKIVIFNSTKGFLNKNFSIIFLIIYLILFHCLKRSLTMGTCFKISPFSSLENVIIKSMYFSSSISSNYFRVLTFSVS